MPYIGAKHLATKARGGLAFKSQIPVMPKHQGFYFFNFSHPDYNCRFGISPNQPKNGSQTMTAGLGISPYPENKPVRLREDPPWNGRRAARPRNPVRRIEDPCPIGTELPQTLKASRTKFVP